MAYFNSRYFARTTYFFEVFGKPFSATKYPSKS